MARRKRKVGDMKLSVEADLSVTIVHIMTIITGGALQIYLI
jgi:hypothetical protein